MLSISLDATGVSRSQLGHAQAKVEIHSAHQFDGVDEEVLQRCADERQGLLGCHPDYEDAMSYVDGSVCTATELAGLIEAAPNTTLRHVVRELVYCRRQLAITVGYEFLATEQELSLFNECEDEWQDMLGQFPKFNAWLVAADRFTCSRATLLEAICRAPTGEIRQALREMYSFRETASLAFSTAFA